MCRPDNENLWQDLCEFCQDEGTSTDDRGFAVGLGTPDASASPALSCLFCAYRRQGLDASRLPRAPRWRRHGARLRVHEASARQSPSHVFPCYFAAHHMQALRKPARPAVLSAPRTEGKAVRKVGACSGQPVSVNTLLYIVDGRGELQELGAFGWS